MSILRILFPLKFTQRNLDEIIAKYYKRSKDTEVAEVIFDLSLLEWINTEEVTFLFSWIRGLVLKKRRVNIWMPYPYDIYEQGLYKEPSELAIARSLLPQDNIEHIRRRINRNVFLLSVWGMLENVGLSNTSFKNIVENYNARARRISEKYSHLVIPFTVISSVKSNNVYQNPFTDVINGTKTFRKVEPFDLTKDLISRLQHFNCYSPFENRIISNVITKELFANSLIHANKSGKLAGLEECYFALSLNNQWEDANNDNFISQFLLEKDADTIEFYKDKSQIFKEVKKRLKGLSNDKVAAFADSRLADLSFYQKQFRNMSYLEFTFLDFGDGIHKTLSNNFDEYISVDQNVEHFTNVVRENQILEYAFFPESSSNKYNSRLETPELFPRGLYFLVDMVRRYKGLLVVRSGYGKLVYDFSDRIRLKKTGNEIIPSLIRTFLLEDAIRACDGDGTFFDGTLMSIVLPERQQQDVNYDPIRIDNEKLYKDIYFSRVNTELTPRKIFEISHYEHISMLFLYEKVIRAITPEELATVKGFDSLIYMSLLEELRKRSLEGRLIFIDFEFYPRTDNIHQLLFYLTNSPYINEYTKAVIINLKDNSPREDAPGTRYRVLQDFKVNLYARENEPHIFRPIPSINFNMYERGKLDITSLDWIGVQSSDDEKLLTQLLIGEADNYPLKMFTGRTEMAGNGFAPNQGQLYAIFNTSLDLIKHFEASRDREIYNMILSLVEDGSKPETDEQPYVFQSSQGSFQFRYLSLYESLHNKYLAKFFAKRLLDNFLETAKTNGSVKFDKILTVTVSSQLIGVAIRDLIKEDPAYSIFLKNNDGKRPEPPSMVILASYYAFETEKPFRKISTGEKVLVVNDVIATGSLVQKLIRHITGKGAEVASVMSIADCRINPELNEINAATIISLVKNNGNPLDIERYDDRSKVIVALTKRLAPQFRHQRVITRRINPLLNTVVDLSNEDAENQRVLFKDPLDFLPTSAVQLSEYQKKYFKMGHFVQNLSHHGYLTDMHEMFSNDEGLRIVSAIKDKMEAEYHEGTDSEQDDDIKLFSILGLTEQLKNRELAAKISDFFSHLQYSEGALIEERPIRFYTPDFIFHPVFSGIESLNPQHFHDLFGTPYENIIGLQRFETDKGWRFPFPPKRFNNITKDKHILIFDSGALTGESLIQMIDTISILDVSKIDMISVVGRVEDFNREFFSRIKSLKVKSLKRMASQLTGGETLDEKSFKRKISLANLNIYFGINLHIPVYPSRSNCPFCEEIRELQGYQNLFFGQKLPVPAKDYISNRLIELRIKNIVVDREVELPTYIPKSADQVNNVQTDIVAIFLMRDKLGRIDSYRFYRQYYTPFAVITANLNAAGNDSPEIVRQLELIMICILHEPKLFKVHRELLVTIYQRCKKMLTSVVERQSNAPVFTFQWSEYSIVRLFFIYYDKSEFSLPVFESLFEYASRSSNALNYIAFILWKGLRNYFRDTTIKNKSRAILTAMSDNFDTKGAKRSIYLDNTVRQLIKSIVNTFEITPVESINDAFFNLRKFFFSQSSDNTHSEVKRIILRLVGDIENTDLSDQEISNLLDLSINIRKTLQTSLMENLAAIRNSEMVKFCDELQYHNLFDADSVYARLQELIDLQSDVIARREEISLSHDLTQLKNFIDKLDKFQIEFLLEGRDFVNYCRKYLCDLEKCVNSALNSSRVRTELKKRVNLEIITFKGKNVFVNGHADLLTHAFEEIFFNAAAHANDNKYKDKLRVTMFVKEIPETGVTELTVHQNWEFVTNSRTNGIDKIIKGVFNAFCGDDGITFDTSKKGAYIITIKFNQLDIKNNN